MALTADDILSKDDRSIESIIVPEWGDLKVWVRTMGALERSKYESALIDAKDASLAEKMIKVKVILVILCVCDESGQRLFTMDDFDAIAEKNGDAIDRLYDVISRINLMTQGEVEEEKKD